MAKILIKSGTIVSPGIGVFPADVLIDGDRISSVSTDIPVVPGIEAINAAGKIVMPGLIQGHTHLCQMFSRAFAEDVPLLDWLEERIIPMELAHDYDTLFASARLGAAELLRTGVTTALDMGAFKFQEAVFDGAISLGLRILSGAAIANNTELWKPARLLSSTEQQMQYAEKMISQYENHPLAQYVLCPRFLLGVNPSMWEMLVALASETGAKIHTHASENMLETKLFRDKYGMGNVEALKKLRALSKNTFVAHFIHIE